MGEVYCARDTRLNRSVAIKVLPAHLANDPLSLERFTREAQALATLSHPNILALHDLGREGQISFVVMELLEGATLRDLLEAATPHGLPLRKTLDFARQLASGLAAAHQKGVVHRDLKPENLFVTTDGRLKILDFGLARASGVGVPAHADVTRVSNTTAPGTVMGTVGYMAPEQARGLTVDHRADIFAVGVILNETLTGQRAFAGDTPADTLSAVLTTDPPDVTESVREVPAIVGAIVRRCLEKNPDERFHSVHDLGVMFDTLVQGRSAPDMPAVDAPAPKARRASHWRLAAAVGAAVIVGAVADYWFWPTAAAVPSYTRVSFRRGMIHWARFAPDGQTIVYGDGRERVVAQGPAALLLHDLAPDGRVLLSHEIPSRVMAVSTPGNPAERNLSWLDGSEPKDLTADGSQLLVGEFGVGVASCGRR